MNGPEEYAQRLRDARNRAGLTQSEAETYLRGRGLRVSARSLSKWENGEGPPKQVDGDKVIRLLHGYDEHAVESIQKGDPIYDTPASAGDGSEVLAETPSGHMPPSRSLSSAGRDVFWMPVQGDSMGQAYKKHSLIPVARFDNPAQDIATDDVYVIRLEGAIQIKRLQRLPGHRIRIISDNPAYPNEEISLDDGVDFEVIGQVLV